MLFKNLFVTLAPAMECKQYCCSVFTVEAIEALSNLQLTMVWVYCPSDSPWPTLVYALFEIENVTKPCIKNYTLMSKNN